MDYFKNTIKTNDEELVIALLNDMLIYFQALLTKKDEVNIAISGGTTPQLLFENMSLHFANKFPWSQMHFYWADERCVPHNHAESNFGNAQKLLFSKVGIAPRNIHPVNFCQNATAEALRYGTEIKMRLPVKNYLPVFDLILLGMGADGHTASIFPGREDLFFTNSVCEAVQHPQTGQSRISLSGNVINNAENIVFLVTGAQKAEKVKWVFNKNAEKIFPACYVAPKSGNIFWYLDVAAASQIEV